MLWGGAGVDILNMVSREAHQEDGCSLGLEASEEVSHPDLHCLNAWGSIRSSQVTREERQIKPQG